MPAERLNVVMGSYVSATVVGGLSGRLLGGFLFPAAHWRWAFLAAAALLLGGHPGGLRRPAPGEPGMTRPDGRPRASGTVAVPPRPLFRPLLRGRRRLLRLLLRVQLHALLPATARPSTGPPAPSRCSTCPTSWGAWWRGRWPGSSATAWATAPPWCWGPWCSGRGWG